MDIKDTFVDDFVQDVVCDINEIGIPAGVVVVVAAAAANDIVPDK